MSITTPIPFSIPSIYSHFTPTYDRDSIPTCDSEFPSTGYDDDEMIESGFGVVKTSPSNFGPSFELYDYENNSREGLISPSLFH